ncbi:MAG: protoheme IX farnesyltransferase [Spirochaetia bacterium]|nr:protoheme IX farnesyltransferase [Spirochaetia bacterium]
MESIKKWFGLILELGKARITVSVTVTTAIGYFLAPEPWENSAIWPILGILFIGFASASLNHLQDRKIDIKMHRTRNRPFPEGRVTAFQTLVIIFIFSLLGCGILYFLSGGKKPLILGLSAFFWYNGIYTNLKRISSIAVVPGALIGGIPPALGWASAGGNILDPFIVSISSMLIIWQVPHFWLLLFMYSDDYDRAGLPNLIHNMGEKSLRVLTFFTILLTIFGAIWIFYEGELFLHWSFFLAIAASIKLVLDSLDMMRFYKKPVYKKMFMSINIYTLIVLSLVIAGRFIPYGKISI